MAIEQRVSRKPGPLSTLQAMENTQRTTRLQDKLAYLAWNALGNTQSQVPRLGCMHWLGEAFDAKV